jgi:hypothetical protein
MKKEFIPYEQALALKELGFDEPCLAQYKKYVFGEAALDIGFSKNEIISKFDNLILFCSAPLYQQAFRWFREKYKLVNYIEYYAEWNFEIFRIDDKIAEVQDDVNVDYTFKGGTYEEAELECLSKLIEIVKKQKEDESNIIV